jgi:hypothetical protein
MPMKRRAAGRRRRNVAASESSSSDVVVRGGDLGGVRVSEPAPGDGAAEVYFVVAWTVPADRDWDRLGHVPVLSLSKTDANERQVVGKKAGSRDELTEFFYGC